MVVALQLTGEPAVVFSPVDGAQEKVLAPVAAIEVLKPLQMVAVVGVTVTTGTALTVMLCVAVLWQPNVVPVTV